MTAHKHAANMALAFSPPSEQGAVNEARQSLHSSLHHLV
jgi:hypothetical protein